MNNKVNQTAVNIITSTSIDYCKTSIQSANLPTIRAALKIEKEKRQRTSLIKQLESKERKLIKES